MLKTQIIPTYIKKIYLLIVCSPPRIFADLDRLIQTLENYKIGFFYEILYIKLGTWPSFFKKQCFIVIK